MNVHSALVLACALMFAVHSAHAEPDDLTLKGWLEKPILGKGLTQSEAVAICESKFPKMPAVKSAAEWDEFAKKTRERMFSEVILKGAAREWRDAATKVEWLDTISGGPGYRIKKLRYEAVPGLWVPALLYEPTRSEGKFPVVLNVNGHDRESGKAAAYKQMRCIDQAKRGMLALDVEWLGMGQLANSGNEHNRIVELDLCGTSGIATHYLLMKRGLDILLAHDRADATRVAVTGLSGGGWQTIFFSPLDARVTFCNPVAGYSSFFTRSRFASDLGDYEQTPCDMATVADYTHLTAMMADRSALLTFNAQDDCCFRADHALQPLLDAAAPIFRLHGREAALRSHVNLDPGTHNYERNNREAFSRMIGDQFFAGASFDPKELAREGEIKTRGEFEIPLPETNATVHSLALALAKDLPRRLEGDTHAQAEKLKSVVRWNEWEAGTTRSAMETKAGVTASFFLFKLGPWSVPAIELEPEGAQATVVVINDQGKAKALDLIKSLLAEKKRVVALDPFYVGESRFTDHDYLYALLLTTVGERPLGIAAGQVQGAIIAIKKRHPEGELTLDASGKRSGVVALVAAAIAPSGTLEGLKIRDRLGSLRDTLASDLNYAAAPELYCFGLLEHFDIDQLDSLAQAKLRR